VTPEVARALKLARPAGAILTDLWPGGPAAAAGLREGDVIISVDNEPVYDEGALRYRIGVKNDGDAAAVVFVRDGKEQSAAVRLRLPPDQPARDERTLEGDHPLNGVTVDNLSPRFNEETGLDPFRTGVVVMNLDRRTYAARSGLRPGFRILSVNGKKVTTTADLARELAKPAAGWQFDIDTGERIVPWRVGR
jgi:S1-C subfamily serine protease